MSVQPEGLVDPRDAFLANGLAPGATFAAAASAPAEAAAISGIGIMIGAAVVAGTILVKRELQKSHPRTSAEVQDVSHKAWQKVMPSWLKIALPAITQAYSLGATGTLNYNELEILATDYATDLGEYVNKTSADALMEGFAAQVNAGWNGDLAWERAKEAYGLDSRQMRSYISNLMAQDPKSYISDPIPAVARSVINQSVSIRAERIGTNEAYKATQVGRNMVWLAMAQQGDIPDGTRKKWVTAEDERVCEVCGPLDGRVIPLHWKFKANTGERFYAPGVHPNCRCKLEIVYPELDYTDVVKAMPGDPYDRDRAGRFASTEQRSATDILRDRKPQAKADSSNPLAVLRQPKSDALKYVGSNPVARSGALEVLRAGKASPIAVLAEAKQKEEAVAPEVKAKPKPAAKPEAEPEKAILPEGRNDSTAWAYGDTALNDAGIKDIDEIEEGGLVDFSRVNGYVANEFDNAINEAMASVAIRNAHASNVDVSQTPQTQPVILKFNQWDGDSNEGYDNPPWLDKSNAKINGTYIVQSKYQTHLPERFMTSDGSDQFTKVWVVTLKPV